MQERSGALDTHDQVLYLQPSSETELCYESFGTELWAKNGSGSSMTKRVTIAFMYSRHGSKV